MVARLRAAGALCLGKTNLDQFATGLVGVRSPYGVPRNPFDARYIPGGSSSGSAVAVAAGLVSFALGTDTAGSGRVPAAFNNIVGLKPTRGVLSTTGVVPACRSLDCVSVFALTVEDAAQVAELLRGYDESDPGARPDAGAVRFAPTAAPPRFRFGVPAGPALDFRGDLAAQSVFERTLETLAASGGQRVEIDFAPFREAAGLLYDGPFVAERLAATGGLLASAPGAIIGPVRTILESAARFDAAAAFEAQHRLRQLRRVAARALAAVDFLLVPTTPTIFRIDEVEADPLGLNSALGAYANFVNLLDLAAVAVPTGFRADGLPAGATVIGPAGSDARLAAFASLVHRATSRTLGAGPHPLPPTPPVAPGAGLISIAVVGAHLSGQPLNHQLTMLDGRFVRATRTAPVYRLYALPNTTPAKPGLGPRRQRRRRDRARGLGAVGGGLRDLRRGGATPALHRQPLAGGRNARLRLSLRRLRARRRDRHLELRRLARLSAVEGLSRSPDADRRQRGRNGEGRLDPPAPTRKWHRLRSDSSSSRGVETFTIMGSSRQLPTCCAGSS